MKWIESMIPTRAVLEGYELLECWSEEGIPVDEQLSIRFPGCPPRIIWDALDRDKDSGLISCGAALSVGKLTGVGTAKLRQIEHEENHRLSKLVLVHKVLFERYLKICLENLACAELNYQRETHVKHLTWLCYQALDAICAGNFPIDKLSRWLGFIQGCLTCKGLIAVETERDISRPMFHEAYAEMQVAIPVTIQSSDPAYSYRKAASAEDIQKFLDKPYP